LIKLSTLFFKVAFNKKQEYLSDNNNSGKTTRKTFITFIDVSFKKEIIQ